MTRGAARMFALKPGRKLTNALSGDKGKSLRRGQKERQLPPGVAAGAGNAMEGAGPLGPTPLSVGRR